MAAMPTPDQIKVLQTVNNLNKSLAHLKTVRDTIRGTLAADPHGKDAGSLEAQLILLDGEIEEVDTAIEGVLAAPGTVRAPTDDEIQDIERRASRVDGLIKN